MTKKRASAGKEQVKKPKLRKLTIRDLDSKRKARDVMGGWINTAKACKP